MPLDNVYIFDMLAAAQKIVRVTASYTEDTFSRDDIIQDSVIRQISIIAEAAKHVSDSFKEQNTAIPWHEIKGMRNRLVHDYKNIDLNEVWKTIQNDVPSLINMLKPLLPEQDS